MRGGEKEDGEEKGKRRRRRRRRGVLGGKGREGGRVGPPYNLSHVRERQG
jgi:hypothetical protein